jgi:hypothetical protein
MEMKMESVSESSDLKIAYLGWGSLIWDPRDLPIQGWKRTQLELPLEFSRISDKGVGRITLVINPAGKMNRVWSAFSTETNIDSAIHALRVRENTVKKNIAYINRFTHKRRTTNTPNYIVKQIEAWAIKENINVVIWTDLQSSVWLPISRNLQDKKFTNIKGFQYYLSKPLDMQLKIIEYIYKAHKIAGIHTSFSNYFFSNLLHGSVFIS